MVSEDANIFKPNDLWETMTEDKPIRSLPKEPTMAQIKSHNEEKAKKSKVKSLI